MNGTALRKADRRFKPKRLVDCMPPPVPLAAGGSNNSVPQHDRQVQQMSQRRGWRRKISDRGARMGIVSFSSGPPPCDGGARSSQCKARNRKEVELAQLPIAHLPRSTPSLLSTIVKGHGLGLSYKNLGGPSGEQLASKRRLLVWRRGCP